MSSSDLEYYRKRAIAERALAKTASHSEVAAIHEELARQYEALVEQAELRPTLRIAISTRIPTPPSEAQLDGTSRVA